MTISETEKPKPISQILDEFKPHIFKDFKFAFDEFEGAGGEGGRGSEMDAEERQNCAKMLDVCKGLVRQFGGEVLAKGSKFAATHWVHYHRPSGTDEALTYCPPIIKRIHFTYITECFFAIGRKDITKFLI